MTALAHRLDRTIVIEAPQSSVFRYFTDSARWAAWWGAGSTIDARPGGRVYVRHPGNVEASGEVVDVTPPSRIVFTYGFDKGQPFGPGESRVTVDLERVARGTRLRLVHELPDAASRDHHVQGWRYQLSLFANVVTDEIHADAGALADRWFAVWAEPDAAARTAALEAIALPGVRMRDRFSSVEGTEELTLHIGAAQRFMPGLRLQRSGDARHCQGTVLTDWTAQGADGAPKGRGTNVFSIDADGRIESVTGFWTQP
jgi:uncharacterized protein YndB with AHSA1/START domain